MVPRRKTPRRRRRASRLGRLGSTAELGMSPVAGCCFDGTEEEHGFLPFVLGGEGRFLECGIMAIVDHLV